MSSEHPGEADWMEWLYGECPEPRRQQLQAHLSSCEQCDAKVQRWQRVLSVLDTDQSARRTDTTSSRSIRAEGTGRSRSKSSIAVLAASICLAAIGGAFASSLVASSAVDEDRIRTQVVQQMRSEMQSEMQNFVRGQMASSDANEQKLLPLIHDESGRVVAATLAGWVQQDSQRREQMQQLLQDVLRNQIALRQDLETLALEAEAQILRTRRELIRVNSAAEQLERQSLPPLGEQGLPDGDRIERY